MFTQKGSELWGTEMALTYDTRPPPQSAASRSDRSTNADAHSGSIDVAGRVDPATWCAEWIRNGSSHSRAERLGSCRRNLRRPAISARRWATGRDDDGTIRTRIGRGWVIGRRMDMPHWAAGICQRWWLRRPPGCALEEAVGAHSGRSNNSCGYCSQRCSRSVECYYCY